MDGLIWAGATVSAAGLVGLVYCIVSVWRARRAGLDDAALRDRVRRIVPVNMAALLLSVLGLMMVVVGILLA